MIPTIKNKMLPIIFLALSTFLTPQSKADGVRCAARDFLGLYNTPSDALGVTVSGTTAYVADGASGLQIIGLSDCPPCAADLTNDGVIDFFDVSAFLSAFGNSDPLADFTGDGIFDFFDVSAFLQAFAAGCP